MGNGGPHALSTKPGEVATSPSGRTAIVFGRAACGVPHAVVKEAPGLKPPALSRTSSAAVWTRMSSYRCRSETSRRTRCDYGRKRPGYAHRRPVWSAICGPATARDRTAPTDTRTRRAPASHWRKEKRVMSESVTYRTEGAPTRDQV